MSQLSDGSSASDPGEDRAPLAQQAPASTLDSHERFLSGAALVFAPLFLLALPLLFHRSEVAAVGSYSRGYAIGLLVLFVAMLAGSAAIGRLCQRRASLLPAKFCLLLLGSAAFALGLAEFVLRYSYLNDAFRGYKILGQKKSLVSGFETRPNLRFENHGVHYSSDASGFRTHLSDPAWREKSGPRIFALGGSSTFGIPIEDDETWPHRLEAELRRLTPEQDPAFTVINAGNPGHNSLQVLLRVYAKVMMYRPRALVYYEARNDARTKPAGVTDTMISEEILFAPSLVDYLHHDREHQNWYLRTLTNRAIESVISRLSRRGPLELEPPPKPPEDPKLQREIMENNGRHYLRNLTTLADVCRREGVLLVLVTFLSDPATVDAYAGRSIQHHNDLLRGLAAREGLPLIDLARDFAAVEIKQPYVVSDGYHPTALGARYIGEHVAEGLAPLLRSR